MCCLYCALKTMWILCYPSYPYCPDCKHRQESPANMTTWQWSIAHTNEQISENHTDWENLRADMCTQDTWQVSVVLCPAEERRGEWCVIGSCHCPVKIRACVHTNQHGNHITRQQNLPIYPWMKYHSATYNCIHVKNNKNQSTASCGLNWMRAINELC